MPNGDHIYADELINSLSQLKKENKFQKMILVIDSPNAASFFEPFEEELKNINILAISST
jgi:glycosylphosphatidylinositol transamidase (GPIT) subunit GPI8